MAPGMKPSRREIEALARAESDPRRFDEFRPVTRGPFVAVLLFVYIGFASVLLLPYRMIRSLF